jgi:predicted unusual protein kinase regulating ubiquinone biosynthesis (AarF/ABC1/UbiB family)
MPWEKVVKVLEEEYEGEPLSELFAEFEEEAFAAASIGQVHRAVTTEGKAVAVKIQYPGIAEAVETDLRNMQMVFPLVKRLAPGLDVNALAQELRERIGDELDYEVEAQNHRAMARAWRGHPFAHVPNVDTRRSRRRVLVTELIAGKRFEEVKRLDEHERDRFGEILFRFFFGTLKHTRRASGDPHPGNYLLMDDGRVGFLDFGLMRVVDADYLEGERRLAQAVEREDAQAVHEGLAALGYLPQADAFDSERLLDQIRTAGEWYLEPGFRRLTPAYVTDLIDRGSSPRSPFFEEMRRETIPPQALLIRRMEGLVLSTLGELRAGADWSKLGSEYWSDAPPSTELGEQDARFWGLPGFT